MKPVLSHPLSFALPFLLPAVFVWGALVGGAGAFAVPVLIFVLVPFLDRWFGDDPRDPEPREMERLERAPIYSVLLYAWVPVQLAVLVFALWLVPGLGWLEQVGLALSLGILTGGIGITVAHELGHRRPARADVAAWVLLTSVGYAYFTVEHNKGHHARVATPEDPASASAGESLYRFLPRTFTGSVISAWRLESERLAGAVWSPRNRVLMSFLTTVGITLTLAAWLGASAASLFLAQALIATGLLETVNYIEHYGLRRRRLADGRYERVAARHSWESRAALSNRLLFNLQRHPHHHTHQGRPYQVLETRDDSPQLPAGYPTMILLALVPPLWRAAVGPRIPADMHEEAT